VARWTTGTVRGVTEEKPMSTVSSVTQWVNKLQAGDRAAVQKLWEKYFQKLVRLARRKLRGTPRKVADEDDVALSAFDSFCRGAEKGRFPQLNDRNDLWHLLVVITARKAADLAVYEWRRTPHGKQQPPGATNGGANGETPTFPEVIGREPDPAFAAQVADECRRLLDQLDDADLRALALWKMEGYTNQEVGEKLGCAVATVERRLRVIRKLWAKELEPGPAGRGDEAAPG
jgi:DNA-directed RNA polymerase specialized sigma24 family protein